MPARSFRTSSISLPRSIVSRSLSMLSLLACSKQKGCIPERIEAIPRSNGMRIGGPHALEAGEGRDEHEQGRTGQMEVGHQDVDGAEAITRRDEDVGRAAEWLQLPGGRGALEQAQRGGA